MVATSPLLPAGAWINGSLCDQSSLWDDVRNPLDRSVIGAVPKLSSEQVTTALEGSHNLFSEWRTSTGHARARLLRATAATIRTHEELFARTITLEQGKPLSEAKAEVAYSVAYLEWFAGEAERIRGEIIDGPTTPGAIHVRYEPIGTTAVITPWNFPLAMLARKVGAAWAAGCPVVCKPAPETPFTALRFAEVATAAGLPPGAIQVVTGDAPQIGSLLLSSPIIRKLSFTGSTATGKVLMRQAAERVLRVTLELGGNAPFIVWPDADLPRAAREGAAAKFRNAGQTCISCNRFFVHRRVVEPFIELLKGEMAHLRLGDGMNAATTLGPLTQPSRPRVLSTLVDEALTAGACIAAGERSDPSQPLMSPLIVAGVSDTMRIAQEELFGPVCSILTFDEDDEVYARANNTPAGLIAYAYSGSARRLAEAARRLEAGMIGLNETRLSLVFAPFGGVKESGIGREGHWMGLREYQEVRYCCEGPE